MIQMTMDKNDYYIFIFYLFDTNIYHSSINSSNNEKCVVSFSVVLLSTLVPLLLF